jgi:superfamily I DNA/RNA helicase
MDWSLQQKHIFQEVRDNTENLFVSALAGTGKTTTLVRLSEEIDPSLSTIFMCFGRNDKETLEARVPSNIQCRTLHSKGLSAINDHSRANGGSYIKPNEWKCSNIYRELGGPPDLQSIVLELVGYGKTVATKHPVWDDIITARNMVVNGDAGLVMQLADEVFQKSLQQTKIIDYDDMLLFPALGIVPVKSMRSF